MNCFNHCLVDITLHGAMTYQVGEQNCQLYVVFIGPWLRGCQAGVEVRGEQ